MPTALGVAPGPVPDVVRWDRGARVRETLGVALVLAVFEIPMAFEPGVVFLAGRCFLGVFIVLSLVRAGVYMLGRDEVLLFDGESVRWRRGILRPRYSAIAWHDVRVAHLDRVRVGRSSEPAIILVRKPATGALLQAGKPAPNPVIIIRALDRDPEAVLDAFRRYVFVQDLRENPY